MIFSCPQALAGHATVRHKVDDRLWLSIHDYFLLNPDKWDNGVTYAELWQQYTTKTQRTD